MATSSDLQGINGAYFEPIARPASVATHAQNAALQTRLWDESEKYVLIVQLRDGLLNVLKL